MIRDVRNNRRVTNFSKVATKTVAALGGIALTMLVAVAPANAATDVNLDAPSVSSSVHGSQAEPGTRTIGDQPAVAQQNAKDAMPDNPSQKLPSRVSEAIPDNAKVVSKDLAVTTDGQVKNVETGAPVTDPKLVGTADQQPDPLAKTNGVRFIPVNASEVKKAVAANGGDVQAGDSSSSSADSASVSKSSLRSTSPKSSQNGVVKSAVGNETNGTVNNARLQDNGYGAYWGSYNGTQAFFERGGNLFAQQAKGVIDVSEHQGTIDWQTVKNSGVEGAIIRVAFGWGNRLDYQAARNISECKRLGIPFGVYFYSYAYDYDTATQEGFDAVNKLREVGVNPGDLSYPVFYDLESWDWSGHYPPTDPAVYDSMVNTWYWCLQHFGYNNLSVYSYTYYLDTALNSGNIRSKTRWVASYGPRTNFGYSTNDRGWQYASNGSINGIYGSVDINAFGNYWYQSAVDLATFKRDEDIAVCGVVNTPNPNVEYEFLSYDLAAKVWKPIAWWQDANCAGWTENVGDYWLHLEVRDKASQNIIGTKTIVMRYSTNATITGIYVGPQGRDLLLGAASNDSRAKYVMKLYDVSANKWFTQFNQQWAVWHPHRGVFWVDYELYTSDGRLADSTIHVFSV
ncbi:GH25 family lysozyme [Bifidobacterium sp. ESL0790]|uniref:glycoside hydrolase family 25 protein n=1 Tax=Bifidobacterium sp. ESL0790 TaxID=2983233 RepID=UPI0023FA29A9|nr:GH25 family lysozyme [Bifidobacterium sp. ESL0790]WEV72349.1 GH25 family lysozyme [Bifidobacterium sp. ESL0790]